MNAGRVSRRGILARVASGSAVLAAACGTPKQGGDATLTGGSAGQPARVAVMTFSSGLEIDSFKGLFADFAKRFPDITVDFSPAGM